MIHSLPIILPKAVTFFLSAPLLMMKGTLRIYCKVRPD
jgi:hypothetical protein